MTKVAFFSRHLKIELPLKTNFLREVRKADLPDFYFAKSKILACEEKKNVCVCVHTHSQRERGGGDKKQGMPDATDACQSI